MIEEAMSNAQLREMITHEHYLKLKDLEPGTKEYADHQAAIESLEKISQKDLEIENNRINAYSRSENDAEKNRIEAERVKVERKKVISGWLQAGGNFFGGVLLGLASFSGALFPPNKTFWKAAEDMFRQTKDYLRR